MMTGKLTNPSNPSVKLTELEAPTITNIANGIINLMCGIAVFITVLVLVKLILKILDIVDYIPVVGQLNKMLGGVVGIAEFIMILWIFFTVRYNDNLFCFFESLRMVFHKG